VRFVSRSEHAREPAARADPPAPTVGELPSEGQVRAAVTAFAMLAEPTRLRLLWLVSSRELDVTSLAARLSTSVSIVSAHLAKLRLAGLVETRKDGRHVLYRARDTHVRKLIAEAMYHADHHITGVADHD